MTIERVCENDAGELLKIYAPYVEKTAITFEYIVPDEEEFKERIRTISSKYPYIKAVEAGEILGYAYAGVFKGRKAYDYSVETTIYVRSDMKRRGVGRFLYEQLEKSLKSMGILNMNACIASPSKESVYLDESSYEFHKSQGFSLVGRFHDSGYKFNQWFDMIWMEKMIGEHSTGMSEVSFGKWSL